MVCSTARPALRNSFKLHRPWKFKNSSAKRASFSVLVCLLYRGPHLCDAEIPAGKAWPGSVSMTLIRPVHLDPPFTLTLFNFLTTTVLYYCSLFIGYVTEHYYRQQRRYGFKLLTCFVQKSRKHMLDDSRAEQTRVRVLHCYAVSAVQQLAQWLCLLLPRFALAISVLQVCSKINKLK